MRKMIYKFIDKLEKNNKNISDNSNVKNFLILTIIIPTNISTTTKNGCRNSNCLPDLIAKFKLKEFNYGYK